MCAAAFDFVAERGFIAASDDPNQLFDWMNDYDQRRRDAQADDDDQAAAQFQELRQEAEDRVVELKSARLRRVAPRPAAPEPVQPAAGPPTRREVERPAKTSAYEAPAATVDPLAVARAERARRRAEEEAAARKATEEAEAAAERAAEEELRQLQERAANAKARRDAALAATARIEADAKRAAAEAAREQARRQAAKEVEDAERTAAEAEAAARGAATSAAKRPPGPPDGPPRGRVVESPRPKVDEPTPLALLFQERLTEVMGAPTETLPAPRPSIAPPSASATSLRSPVPSRRLAAPPIPAKVPAPAPDPVDDLPALTGADLASYRTWLGASQRALANKLAVEQSVISKSEARPATVLPPQLRRALHLAMQEPRDAARGAS